MGTEEWLTYGQERDNKICDGRLEVYNRWLAGLRHIVTVLELQAHIFRQ